MPFKSGESGNPGGRVKAANRAFADILRVAVSVTEGDKTKLRLLADALVEEAIKGNVLAIREIADRLDGKCTTPLEHSGNVAFELSPLSEYDDNL